MAICSQLNERVRDQASKLTSTHVRTRYFQPLTTERVGIKNDAQCNPSDSRTTHPTGISCTYTDPSVPLRREMPYDDRRVFFWFDLVMKIQFEYIIEALVGFPVRIIKKLTQQYTV